MRYLPYYKLDCNNLHSIQHDVLAFVHSTSLIDSYDTQWNTVDVKLLLKSCPNLLEYIKKLRLAPQSASIVVLEKDFHLHVDVPPVIAKINFPISNCDKSENYWVGIEPQELDKFPIKVNYHSQHNIDFSSVDQQWLNRWPRYTLDCFDTPIVFNSEIPHGVLYNYHQPRLMLSMTFVNEPLNFLCIDKNQSTVNTAVTISNNHK